MDYILNPLLYLALFLPLYLISKHFHRKFKNHPPAPFLTLPLLGHLYLFKKPLHRSLTNISNRYGPVLLLDFGSRKVLLVSSPSAAEECLSKHDVVFANRPRLMAGKYIGCNYTSLAWTPYGDHWRNLRRISATEILSTHRLQMLHDIRADEVKHMIRKIDSSSKAGGSPVEMKSVFFELMLNLMMRMIAGKRYFGENVEDLKEANRFREIVSEILLISGVTNVADFVPSLTKVFRSLEKRFVKVQRSRDAFMQDLIEDCRKKIAENISTGEDTEGKKKSFVQVLLKLQENEPEYYQDEIIRGLMSVMLAAGTETSAGTMEWGLSLLLNHPEILKAAQKEIDDLTGQKRLIQESDLGNLPYLHCILNEIMRMFPAGPLLVPHESSEECTVGGYRVPAGTMLMINVYSIQRDPKYWDEPEKFKPERFEGFAGVRDGFKMMPFGSGRRSCPGEGLALRMVGLSLGSLIQCFDWERIGSEMVDMTEGIGLTMPKALPLTANCKTRPFVADLLSQTGV
ncbi:PREDICTED: isoflavone 2'-hydroxylase-like [Ipomoea nil]|uniref:isoflavone 2'-hydroxylase-like n=1 Tax=Ipomoea nil TaxID=35883 RepID=UPI000901ECF6|nr:PREDICTED: isoflavone 2'-hydroxylase-like [Ipomoea nil]